jgi:hypothetical protein
VLLDALLRLALSTHVQVSSVSKSSFKIGDTTKYPEYKSGGTVSVVM